MDDNTPASIPPLAPQFKAEDAVARATIQVTRAATGKVETHELLFFPLADQASAPVQEA